MHVILPPLKETIMRILVQRAGPSAVHSQGAELGRIESGLVLLIGIASEDGQEQAAALANKVANLRIFADQAGKMNLSLLDIGGSALLISQFTLYANTNRGRRPSFVEAAPPEVAEPLFEFFAEQLELKGIPIQSGRFGANMQVEILNDGPVTILLEQD
jgi:D-tyrosyl-tRNA(Tyr) deacylase